MLSRCWLNITIDAMEGTCSIASVRPDATDLGKCAVRIPESIWKVPTCSLPITRNMMSIVMNVISQKTQQTRQWPYLGRSSHWTLRDSLRQNYLRALGARDPRCISTFRLVWSMVMPSERCLSHAIICLQVGHSIPFILWRGGQSWNSNHHCELKTI